MPKHQRPSRLRLWPILVVALWFTGNSLSRAVLSPPAGGPPGGQLNCYSFDSTNWLSALGQSPRAFTNIANVPGGDGNVLRIDTNGTAAFLSYRVAETNGSNNLQLNVGSVAFWYRPHNWAGTNAGGSGPGEWSRFLEVGRDTNNSSWWSIFTDPGGGHIYFAAQTNTGSATYFLTAPVTFASNAWHYIALTYTNNASTLYVDGVLLTNGLGVTVWPGLEATTNGFFVGSASDGTATMHGDMDDLATFSYQLNQISIAGTYGVFGLPFYGVNLSSVLPSGPSIPIFGTNAFGAAAFNGYGVNVITGPGNLTSLGASGICITSGQPQFTNLVAQIQTNGTCHFTFSIIGGTIGVPYDIFGTVLIEGATLTNSPWAWLGQGYTCQSYQLTNQPGQAFYIMGTPQDSDGDGLTDVYERLVSKTDPTKVDSDADGVPEAWLVLNGFQPQAFSAAGDPDGDGLTNKQEYLWGTRPNVSEGITVWVANPAGFSGIP